jgi:four helix bundle protein
MKENILKKKSFDFEVVVIDICSQLNKKKLYVISNQLLRSGTSIGANIEEADAAQSKKDFITKMSIAAKEARESNYWLRLIQTSSRNQIDCNEGLALSDEIIKMLTASIKTAQQRLNTKH